MQSMYATRCHQISCFRQSFRKAVMKELHSSILGGMHPILQLIHKLALPELENEDALSLMKECVRFNACCIDEPQLDQRHHNHQLNALPIVTIVHAECN